MLCGARTNIVRCSARICATVKFIHFFTEFIFLRNSQQFINIKNSCMSGGGGDVGHKSKRTSSFTWLGIASSLTLGSNGHYGNVGISCGIYILKSKVHEQFLNVL